MISRIFFLIVAAMTHAKEIVAALGGRQAAAALCGITDEAIKKWEQSGVVPPKHWSAIVNALDDESLWRKLAALKDAG